MRLPALSRGLALAGALLCCACGSADNPPPAREAPASPGERPGGADHVLRVPPSTIDPARPARLGHQRGVLVRLLDRLDPAAAALRDAPRASHRSYPNPWRVNAPVAADQRVNWKTGTKNEWRLAQSLVLAAGAGVEWQLDLPPGARLELGAAGVRGPESPADAPASVRVTVNGVAAATALSPTAWDEPLAVTPLSVPLPAGRVALRFDAVGGAGARVAFTEPVVTTDDAAALTAATGVAAADNLILVVVDAQRADTVGPVARDRKRPRLFPTMEGLADAGSSFRSALSAANSTRPSTYGFLSSQWQGYGRIHSVTWPMAPEDKARFYRGGLPLLPRILGPLGYRSVAIGDDAFLFGHQDVGLDAAFDLVIDHRNSVMDTPWMSDSAITWLEAHHDQRFFMLLNYNSPHRPYEPPDEVMADVRTRIDAAAPGLTTEPLGRKYLGEVGWVDLHLARVLAALDRLGLASKTVVAFTADHGEVFDKDHQCQLRDDKEPKCYTGHGMTLFDEELHVPLLVRQPGRIVAGRVIDTRASLLDLPPTFLGLAGFQPHPEHLGRDWSSTLLGGPELPPALIRAESRRAVALYEGPWKYVWADPMLRHRYVLPTLWDSTKTNEQLYDLRSDPQEKVTLALTHPDDTAAMRKRLFEHNDALAARRGEPPSTWGLRTLRSGKWRVVVSTGGRVVDATVDGVSVECGAARFTRTFRGEKTVRFRTVPDDAPIRVRVWLDDKSVDMKGAGVGAFGLELLEDGFIESAATRARVTAPDAGPAVPTSDDGPPLLLWRADATVVRGATGGESIQDSEVQAMMKAWGYQ